MGEYLVSVVALSAALGLISYISYPASFERMFKFASAVLILYTALLPIASIVSDVADGDLKIEFSDTGALGDYTNGEYIEVAKSAFEEGICQYLCTKYSFPEEEVLVTVYGFRFKDMAADRICVKLYGKAAFADSRLIADELSRLGLGACEVSLGFG